MSNRNGHSSGSNHGKNSKNGSRDDSHARGNEHHNYGGHHDSGQHNGTGHDHGHHHDRGHGRDHDHHHGHGRGHGRGHDHHHHHGRGHGHDGEGQNGLPTAVDDAAAVQEDLTLAAGGNVLANDTDPDAGDSKTVVAVEGSAGNVGISVVGLYGTLIIHADGSYDYTLNNSDAAVQSLAAGEQVTDTFSYTMADDEGETSTANLVITVDGTNDAPVIAEGGDTAGAVTEDTVLSVSGDLDATDMDNNAQLTWSVLGGSVPAPATYHFAIDNFELIKNGATIFEDPFDDNNPPPSAPNFINGNPASYGLAPGNFISESGGRAWLDGKFGNPTLIGTGVGHFPQLATNIDSNNLIFGLKNVHDFTLEGRFDLILPDNDVRYGIRFTDGANHTPDDTISLNVWRDSGGALQVALLESDLVASEINVISSVALNPAPGDDQILLRLDHQAANVGVVTASFDLFSGGVMTSSVALPGFGQIFGTETPGDLSDDENWTRASFDVVDFSATNTSTLDGDYGSLSINQIGSWTYDLDNASPLVQALAEGEEVTDTFTAVVTDEFGATDTETINVTVTGTNDAPVIAEGGDTAGAVTEDTVLSVSGDLDATDVDHGAVLGWTLQGGAPGEVAEDVIGGIDYTFAIDQLSVVKNGITIFDDDFDDGSPPPSGVLFSNGNPGTYGTTGIFAESGSRAIMDGSQAGPTTGLFSSTPFLGHFAMLQTNTSNDPADINLGLKNDDDFTVQARFDLAIPDENGEAYGIRLSDRGGPTGQPGDDVMELFVRRDGTGGVQVAFRERDFAAGEIIGIEAISLAPPAGAEQILLRLSHEAANAGVVTASFDYLDNLGAVIDTHAFTNTGQIFGTETPGNTADDEVWTRAQIATISPGEVVSSSLIGNYGTMTINQNGEWTYQLDNDSPQVQALAQGEQVVDSFTALVADEFGASDTETIDVTVTGLNDAPVIAEGGNTTGAVTEDSVFSVSGDLDATDVDHGAVLGWTLQGGAPGEVAEDVISGVEYTFAIDQLTVAKNGTTIFDDNFDDGSPPPSGVLFSNGIPGTYGTSGTFTESGGRAVMDGSLAGPTQAALFTSIPYLGHLAMLQTNTSNDPANINLGLKNDDDFSVEGRFDLVMPDESGEAYGIRLSDRLPGTQPGDDVMELIVRGDGGGGVRVAFHERDFAAGEVTGIESIGLTPPAGAEQILLRLSHEAANAGVVTASFDYLDNLGAVIGSTHTFTNTGQIFGTETPGNTADDEVWTRAQIVTFSPGEVVSSSLVGDYGTMTIDQNGHWTYQLDNDSPLVQALAAGEQVVDSFTALVADEFGASDTETINVTINGADDAPTTTTVSFYADANNIEEGNPLPFYFHRDVTDTALDVRYTIGTFPANGATPGDDFTSAGATFTEVTPGEWSDPTMTLHFDPGQSDAVLVFDTINDGVVEQFGEAFTVNFDFANNDPNIIFDGAQSEADYVAAFPGADPTQVNIGHIFDILV